jgi:DNA polymerase eta
VVAFVDMESVTNPMIFMSFFSFFLLWQGNCSITKFFNNSQSSFEQKNVRNDQGVKIPLLNVNYLATFLYYVCVTSSLFLIPIVTDTAGSQSGIASYLISNQVEMPAEEIDTNNSGCSTDNMPQVRQAWSYNVDEIDPSIIDELPPEIQDEFRTWLRPRKRPNVVKRGSSITQYFRPDKS